MYNNTQSMSIRPLQGSITSSQGVAEFDKCSDVQGPSKCCIDSYDLHFGCKAFSETLPIETCDSSFLAALIAALKLCHHAYFSSFKQKCMLKQKMPVLQMGV